MTSPVFSIAEHTIPCQHIREYPNGANDDQSVLHLAVKEYRPLNNLNAEPGSVTIIATHAIGFPKESYEPLWEDLVRSCPFKIRGIWIADCSNHGASGVMNEDIQGDDPNWFDHSRDLLHMVNIFRERMVRPIFGVGHSMGSAQLVQLSLIHPRLFYGLILVEPVIQNTFVAGPNAAMLSSFRMDRWPSKEKAAASINKSPFFKVLDPRVVSRYISFGFRELPTAIYPVTEKSKMRSGAVTLTTPKHQEAWSYVRSNFSPLPSDLSDPRERLLSPEFDPLQEGENMFVRPESMLTLLSLPQLRPAVLWVYGSHSPINTPPMEEEKMKVTGIGRGGSGGEKLGKVKKVVLKGAGHLVPFERVQESAIVISTWIGEEMDRYKSDEVFYRTCETLKSEGGRVLSRKWLEGVQLPANAKRPTTEKL